MKKFLKWFGIGLVILVIAVFVLLAINWVLPPEWKMGAEILITLAAVVLSMAFTFLPRLRVEFAALSSENKSLVNLVLVLLLAIVMFIGTCTQYLPIPGIECSQAGLKTLAIYVFLAAGGNQLAYVASPQPGDVRNAKLARSEG